MEFHMQLRGAESKPGDLGSAPGSGPQVLMKQRAGLPDLASVPASAVGTPGSARH